MKKLNCRDLGFDCDAVVTADSDEEILSLAGAHAQKVHGAEITPEVVQAVKANIQEA